jgi:hypothetical protein
VRRILVLLVTVVFLAAACADDDSDSGGDRAQTTTPTEVTPTFTPPPAATTTQPERLFTRSDLPGLALRPSDAPKGMRYTKQESGHKALGEVGIALDTQINELRALQFRAVYDATFDTPAADLRLAARLWLFRQTGGASQWLERTRANAFAVALQPIQAPSLADGSWAARGNVGGSDVITHAFRSSNLVVIMTFSTQRRTLSEADALAAAQRAVSRARAR